MFRLILMVCFRSNSQFCMLQPHPSLPSHPSHPSQRLLLALVQREPKVNGALLRTTPGQVGTAWGVKFNQGKWGYRQSTNKNDAIYRVLLVNMQILLGKNLVTLPKSGSIDQQKSTFNHQGLEFHVVWIDVADQIYDLENNQSWGYIAEENMTKAGLP